MNYGHRPDWAPAHWEHGDLHHTPGGLLWHLAPHRFGRPGLLAASLRQLADHLDATVSRDRVATPWDRGWDETNTSGPEWRFHRGPELGADIDGDWALEDEHRDWLDGDGWARRQLHRDASALAAMLARRRHALRSVWRDGRPYTEAA